MQSKAYHVNQGRHMATRGFITLIPSFAGGSDHSRNADDLRACLDWITAQGTGPGSLFFGRVNTNRFGLTGHSAGGLSAILAASRDARVKVISLMDPVDNSGSGVAALPRVRIPVALTWSEPSSCNANGSAEVLYAAAGAVKRGIKIAGANHSDPQDPVAFLSTLTCGGANSARQALYRRYMVGWFEYYLREDASSAPWVFQVSGGPLAADLAAGRITYSLTGDPLKLYIAPTNGGALLQPQGLPGQKYVLQASDNPGAPWIDLETNSVDAGGTWVETVEPKRFFRTREFE
jgi:dienelactone hydrolase